MASLLDPVVLFFALGILAGLVKSDLKVPRQLYETLTIYLLVSIGLQGGVKLHGMSVSEFYLPVLGALALGVSLPLIAYPALRLRLDRPNAAALAAHYGSISIVTFAVATAFLEEMGIGYEGYLTILVVILEIPAIIVGILLARDRMNWNAAREVFTGKGVFLLLGGLIMGSVLGPERIEPVSFLFFDLFKGALAFFLLEMGLVVSHRFSDLKEVGWFIVVFALAMPIVGGSVALLIARLLGFSLGGTLLFVVLGASASYLAATAAMRVAVPEAKPTYYVTASLAITFPFNVLIGIPLYFQVIQAVM